MPPNLGKAKVGFGVDDKYLNVINAHLTRTTKPDDVVMEVAIDKKFSRRAGFTPGIFEKGDAVPFPDGFIQNYAGFYPLGNVAASEKHLVKIRTVRTNSG